MVRLVVSLLPGGRKADGIRNYYTFSGGNPDGIEVVHVAVNLQAGQAASTNQFINTYNFGIVLDDTSAVLADKFQNGGQPVFAIINMADSDSDGIPNLLEFALGGDPNVYDLAVRPLFEPDSIDDSALNIVYREAKGIRNIEYEILYSVDLENWKIYQPDISYINREDRPDHTRVTIKVLPQEMARSFFFQIQARATE